MHVIEARNAHEALREGLLLLNDYGIQRDSRNGPVLWAGRVSTVYDNPTEKVTFWQQRDYNIFFNIYESLWMLSGRNDLEPLTRYVKDFGRYSDDSLTLHGAYGYRWRKHFGLDQLKVVAEILSQNPEDRRSVVQIWDVICDLDNPGKDLPCNDMAVFEINPDGRLDMTVFCRSNDMVWGAYFANAFHFGTLLEYMAAWIGVPVGTYTQVSVNFHAYLDTVQPLEGIAKWEGEITQYTDLLSPFTPVQVLNRTGSAVHTLPLVTTTIKNFDSEMRAVTRSADTSNFTDQPSLTEPSLKLAYALLHAHQVYKAEKGGAKYRIPLEIIAETGSDDIDWVKAARLWIERRRDK